MKERWTKDDYEFLMWIVIIILMVALVPVLIFYDWLQYAENWRRILNLINWIINRIAEWLSSH